MSPPTTGRASIASTEPDAHRRAVPGVSAYNGRSFDCEGDACPFDDGECFDVSAYNGRSFDCEKLPSDIIELIGVGLRLQRAELRLRDEDHVWQAHPCPTVSAYNGRSFDCELLPLLPPVRRYGRLRLQRAELRLRVPDGAFGWCTTPKSSPPTTGGASIARCCATNSPASSETCLRLQRAELRLRGLP